jgi:hypothetical protein
LWIFKCSTIQNCACNICKWFYQEETITYLRGGGVMENYTEGTITDDGGIMFFSRRVRDSEVKVIFVIDGRYAVRSDIPTGHHPDVEISHGCHRWRLLNLSAENGESNMNIRFVCKQGVYAGKIIKQWNNDNGAVTKFNRELFQWYRNIIGGYNGTIEFYLWAESRTRTTEALDFGDDGSYEDCFSD